MCLKRDRIASGKQTSPPSQKCGPILRRRTTNCPEPMSEKQINDIAAKIEARFPIMTSQDAKPHPMSVPWSIAELAYSVYAERYGASQSLERLAERGGFGACEMDMFLPDWRERCSEIQALAAEVKRLTDAMEFIGVTFEGDDLKIQPSRKAKWARAQLAMDNVRIENLESEAKRLTDENARLREGLEHYSRESNWTVCDTDARNDRHYRYGHRTDGYDYARKILGGSND